MAKKILPPEGQCERAVYRYVATTTISNYRPLVGANVHARWFTRIKTCLTDANGYFQTSQFRFEVNYSIKWERFNFDIRSGLLGQAWFNGPKQNGDWNLDIENNGMSWVYAHIHRAAYTYYYANTFGIKTPPERNLFKLQRLHIGAMDASGRSKWLAILKFIYFPQVIVYSRFASGTRYSGEQIFGTTIHELAHASHWGMGYTTSQYVLEAIFIEPFLPESWATGVEAVITSRIYNDNYGQGQSWTLSWILDDAGIFNVGGYTPIVWDLIDDYNQRTKGESYPIDNVSGYTLPQLEWALFHASTWHGWRNAIRDLYNNPTESYLNELFANYR
jgi:hypothetical protein